MGHDLSKNGNAVFFSECCRLLDLELQKHQERKILIDVGAGCLQRAIVDFSTVEKWLRRGHILTILDDPEAIIKGDDPQFRSLKDYIASEFTATRCQVYQLANERIQVARRTAAEVALEFEQAIHRLWARTKPRL